MQTIEYGFRKVDPQNLFGFSFLSRRWNHVPEALPALSLLLKLARTVGVGPQEAYLAVLSIQLVDLPAC